MMNIMANTIQLHVAHFDKENEEYLHLVLKRADNLLVYPGMWQVITGRIEERETALKAAMRELNEETGITTDKIWTLPYVASFFNPKSNSISMIPCFGIVARDNCIRLSDEHSGYEWLRIDDCIQSLALPSHKEGSKVFDDYILNSELNDLFLVK
jgi:dATP pyrophosphohydrolase